MPHKYKLVPDSEINCIAEVYDNGHMEVYQQDRSLPYSFKYVELDEDTGISKIYNWVSTEQIFDEEEGVDLDLEMKEETEVEEDFLPEIIQTDYTSNIRPNYK